MSPAKRHDVGNGDMCPGTEHGRMYVLQSGRQWCPDQSHDAKVVARRAAAEKKSAAKQRRGKGTL
jgi:hypothetical protein